MRPTEVAAIIAMAQAKGYKPVVHPAVPKFDQLTQYVYQASINETATEARVSVAIGDVIPDPEGSNVMPL